MNTNSNRAARNAMATAAHRIVEAYSLYKRMAGAIAESQSAVEKANSISVNRNCPQYALIQEEFRRAFTSLMVSAQTVQTAFQAEILKKLRDSAEEEEDFPYRSTDPCIRQADHDGSWNLLAHIEHGWFETCYRHESLQELLETHGVSITGQHCDKTGAFFTVQVEGKSTNFDDIYVDKNR